VSHGYGLRPGRQHLWSATCSELYCYHDYGDHQHDVDEASGHVKREPEKPQYQQDDGNGSKDFGEPSFRSLTCSSP